MPWFGCLVCNRSIYALYQVAHAEAGVLLETQARAFDAMIASLLQLPPAAHGGEDGEVDGFQAKEEEGGEGGRQW